MLSVPEPPPPLVSVVVGAGVVVGAVLVVETAVVVVVGAGVVVPTVYTQLPLLDDLKAPTRHK